MIFFAANGAIAYVQDLSLSDCLSDEKSEPTDKSRTEVSDRDSKVSALGLRRRRTNHSISKRGVVSGSIMKSVSSGHFYNLAPKIPYFHCLPF